MTRRMVNDGLSTQCINGLDFPEFCVVCDGPLRSRADFLCELCRELRIQITRDARPKIGMMPVLAVFHAR